VAVPGEVELVAQLLDLGQGDGEADGQVAEVVPVAGG
jgi:hypothetical protein